MIDYEKQQWLIEAGSYDQLKSSHKGWVDEYLANGAGGHQDEWTDSIAVGSMSFIEKVKLLLGFKAKGRDVIAGGDGYHLREEAASYMAFFRAEKGDIGPENGLLFECKHRIINTLLWPDPTASYMFIQH